LCTSISLLGGRHPDPNIHNPNPNLNPCPILNPNLNLHPYPNTRLYTRRVNDAIIAILDDAVGTGVVPRLAIPQALKVVEPDWAESIDQFVKKYAATTASVYKAGEKFKHIHLYGRPGYAAMSAVLKTHLDRDCMDAKDLQDAFVTSCQLESFFAVIDDVNRASNFISISQNRGQAMAIKSHTFMTAEERLRQEINRRKKTKLPAMTKDEVCLFFLKAVLNHHTK
jgi:hypothetical protein